MTAYLLDTSALLCHFLDERGADRVHDILMGEDDVLIAAPSVLELHVALAATGEREPASVVTDYLEAATSVVDVTLLVARRAWSLRAGSKRRVPTIDCLIAACAAESKATLVHRDPHFTHVDARQLKQLLLDGK